MLPKPDYVGIDIGTSSVKLCQLRRHRNQLKLQHYVSSPLPNGTIVDGAIAKPNQISAAIRELREKHHIKSKRAVISVSGHSVIIKKISLPQMTPEELEESIEWEAEQFIPFGINDVHIDAKIVNDHAVEHGQMDVVLVAAKKDLIEEYSSVVRKAGMVPVICDVDAFAIETMFTANYEVPLGEIIALINVGAAKTNLNILSDGVSALTRDLSVGGNSFTQELQRRFNIDFESAEAMKRDYGSTNAQDSAEQNYAQEDVLAVLQSIANTLANEIQRSLDFYAATHATAPPAQIYLMGGGSRLSLLETNIQNHFATPTTSLNPFRRIILEGHDPEVLHEHASEAAVAVGLALRQVGDG